MIRHLYSMIAAASAGSRVIDGLGPRDAMLDPEEVAMDALRARYASSLPRTSSLTRTQVARLLICSQDKSNLKHISDDTAAEEDAGQ
jgi:hypothetical protein